MDLHEALRTRTARVGVVGLGHTGLPLAVALAEAGFSVVGVDVDEERLLRLAAGERVSPDVAPERAIALFERGRLSASAQRAAIDDAEVLVLALPTPLGADGGPDPAALFDEVARLSPKVGALLLNVSTSHPGTTRALASCFEARGRSIGHDLLVACSPERLDPGNRVHRVENTPRLVGGVTAACAAAAKSLCSAFAPVVEVSSPEIAEAAKLLENSFRAVNLAFVNEFARGCRAMGLDVRQVVDAAATLPHGFMRFDPGPGVGGHCIPVDPHYWVAAVRRAGVDAPLLALSQAINAEVPSWVGAEVEERLVGQGKSLAGAAVLLSGVAYKRGVADVRNSPAEGLLAFLEARGAVVSFDDPHVSTWKGRSRVQGSPYGRWDAVVVVTDHLEVDHRRMAAEARLVVDARGALASGG